MSLRRTNNFEVVEVVEVVLSVRLNRKGTGGFHERKKTS